MHRDRQTDRHINRYRQIHTHKQTHTDTHSHTHKQTNTHTQTHRGARACVGEDKYTDRQKQTQAYSVRHTNRLTGTLLVLPKRACLSTSF